MRTKKKNDNFRLRFYLKNLCNVFNTFHMVTTIWITSLRACIFTFSQNVLILFSFHNVFMNYPCKTQAVRRLFLFQKHTYSISAREFVKIIIIRPNYTSKKGLIFLYEFIIL